MSDQSKVPAVLDKIETQSSLFEKLTPDLRRELDRAIIDHDPPTYRALFDKFKLLEHGVSFIAFYRYARRIRMNAALLQVGQMTLPEGTDIDRLLPQLIGERLVEASLEESTSPRTLHRLAETYRITSAIRFALDRQRAALAEDRQKSIN